MSSFNALSDQAMRPDAAPSVKSSGAATRRRVLALVGAAGLAAGLSGCIEPLYGTLGPGGLESELRAIKVDPIDDRIGHYVAQELIFSLNGSGEQVPPKYRLTVTLKRKVFSPVVDTVTGRATSASLVSDAEYILSPIAGGAPIAQGVAFAVGSYDRFTQRFANVRAARDAEIRDARAVAEQIRTQIAARLAQRR